MLLGACVRVGVRGTKVGMHANATGRAAAPKRRQGVHPTPWRAKCHTQHAHATGRAAAPTRRTSDPLASAKCRTQRAHATGRATAPKRRQGVYPTPWPAASTANSTQMQGVRPTPWQTATAAHSAQMLLAERRCANDARAYIRPLGKQQLPHTAHQCYWQSGGAQTTPGRRQGVHPTPWQAARAAHSTQMLPAERRRPHDARAYIRPLGKQQGPHTAAVLCITVWYVKLRVRGCIVL